MKLLRNYALRAIFRLPCSVESRDNLSLTAPWPLVFLFFIHFSCAGCSTATIARYGPRLSNFRPSHHPPPTGTHEPFQEYLVTCVSRLRIRPFFYSQQPFIPQVSDLPHLYHTTSPPRTGSSPSLIQRSSRADLALWNISLSEGDRMVPNQGAIFFSTTGGSPISMGKFL